VETRIGSRGLLTATAASTAMLTACAMSNQQPQGQAARGAGQRCFLPSQVNGFNAVDSDTVQVTVGVNTIYELQIVGVCPDIDWSQRIGIRSTGGGSWICSGLDAELIVPSPMGVQRCPVTSVRRLSPAEVQAARAKRKH
jgi:hypothetical protein